MKQIHNQGNMPGHVKFFAQELKGKFSGQKETEFWEASSITEFEKNASEIGYEIVPTLDASTDRAYLVGFSVEESKLISLGDSYSQLKMYFIEITSSEFKAWVKKIKHHRELQQIDSALRKEENMLTKKKLLKETK